MPIDSESGFLWKLILKILMTPITLILVLFKKRKFEDVFEPVKYLFEGLFQAKVTMYLIMINIVTFIISAFLNENILMMFVNNSTDIFTTRAYTIITAGFLHASPMHLLGNLLALMVFGRVVERELGSAKMLTIYFGALILSGIFSSLIYIYILKETISAVGASGAIMGLVSTAALLAPWYITFELLIPMPIMVVSWLTIFLDITGVLNPSADGIGHFAHIGGYISIGLLVFLLENSRREQIKKGLITNIISILVIGFLAVFFGIIKI